MLAVYTGADLAAKVQPMVATLDHFKGMKAAPQPCLAIDQVFWQGEAVVAIVATKLRLAEDAAQLVEVAYEELPVVTDMETALDPSSHVIHPSLGDNLCYTRVVDSGNFDQTVDASDVVVERTFRFPRHTGVCLEGRSVVGDYSAADRRLTVYISHQAPNMIQDCYARLLGLKEADVRVICTDVGGSYGIKTHVYGDELATCAIAMDLGRPVKFVADRLESFVSDIHSRDHKVTMKMALTREGRIEPSSSTTCSRSAPTRSIRAPASSRATRSSTSPVSGTTTRPTRPRMVNVFTNMALYSNYRAVGHPVAVGATEGLVDAAARELGIDPIEFRRQQPASAITSSPARRRPG